MRLFIWVMVGIGTLECIGRLYWLSNGYLPPRTPGTTATDCILGFTLVAWGIWLLAAN